MRSCSRNGSPPTPIRRPPTDASLADGVSCDEAGCVTPLAGGGLVALALKPEALADDCERAALVVTARQAPPACASAAMSGDRLRGQGATALRRTRDGFAVDAVRPRGVDRPWSPAVAGGCGDGDNAGAAPGPPRGRWTRRRRKPTCSRRIDVLTSFRGGAKHRTRNSRGSGFASFDAPRNDGARRHLSSSE